MAIAATDMDITTLSRLATRRSESLFRDDVKLCHGAVLNTIAGARLLLIGGAGSIGSATVHALIRFRPSEIIVVDSDENSLAELVRDLRGSADAVALPRIVTLPIDYGSEVCHRMLRERAPFGLVLNFAALKHVRSEKDTCSVLQMLDTNVIKVARLLTWLAEVQSDYRFFSVSTDKAANPVNLMGASKRVMEQLMFSPLYRPAMQGCVTSARFANVAYSDGSLLFGWINRIAKRQPLACPEGARRYFLSLEEAGQICLIASALAANGQVIVPDLHEDTDLQELTSVARQLIEHCGFKPKDYRDESLAKANFSEDVANGRYPLVLTALDTDGEKPFEEFVARGEVAKPMGLPHLKAVQPPAASQAALRNLLASVERALADASVPLDKCEVVTALSEVLPEFRHAHTGLSLDDRF